MPAPIWFTGGDTQPAKTELDGYIVTINQNIVDVTKPPNYNLKAKLIWNLLVYTIKWLQTWR